MGSMLKYIGLIFMASALMPGNPLFGLRGPIAAEESRVAQVLMDLETCRASQGACIVAARIVDGVRVQAAYLARETHEFLAYEETWRLAMR